MNTLFRFNLFSIILFVFCFFIICCSENEDTCEKDKINGDWGDIVENSKCSDTEKAEAYLALGGFDYFSYIGVEDPNLISILGLNPSNWTIKREYFDKAIELSEPLISGTQKTIYLFGNFLALYTYIHGTLDNGANDSTIAFDGNVESSEIETFTRSKLSTDPNGVNTYISEVLIYDNNIESAIEVLGLEGSSDVVVNINVFRSDMIGFISVLNSSI